MDNSVEPIIIYWAAFSLPERQTRMNMIWDPPVRLIDILPASHSKESSYRTCTGANNLFIQTYTLIHPIDVSLKVEGDFDAPIIDTNFNAWNTRPAAFKNCYSIDYDFGWIFFAEESVIMKQTPPYLHNTSDKISATVASGAFDISKWFRPVYPSYILWEGVNSLTLTKGQPAFYLEFQTNRKIILKHFELTSELKNISDEIVKHKDIFPKESFIDMYNKFIKSHRDKRIIKLIKENVLE